jgi:hypothetical protein
MRGNVNVVMSTPRLIRFSNQFEATQHLLDLIVHVRTLLCLASTSQKKKIKPSTTEVTYCTL